MTVFALDLWGAHALFAPPPPDMLVQSDQKDTQFVPPFLTSLEESKHYIDTMEECHIVGKQFSMGEPCCLDDVRMRMCIILYQKKKKKSVFPQFGIPPTS